LKKVVVTVDTDETNHVAKVETKSETSSLLITIEKSKVPVTAHPELCMTTCMLRTMDGTKSMFSFRRMFNTKFSNKTNVFLFNTNQYVFRPPKVNAQ
jgi:hypothetical protein